MHDQAFQPHVPANKKVKEFTLRAIFLGLILGFLFAIANAYLSLKIGTTISASIPAAIMSMALFRIFFKNATILENNLVQTIATVGEGLAAGVIFTIPALIFLGAPASIGRIFLLSALGGILGILFMIPMRRYIIVQEHGILPFPEGTACAEILKAGERSKESAIMAGWGVLTGALYKLCCSAFYFWKEVPSWEFPALNRASFSIDATPALLGVGYIIGPRISTLMFAGGVVGWWIIIPLISLFGAGNVVIYPSSTPIASMGADQLWSNYVRYIGAGTVAIGGLISLFRIGPLIFKTIHVGFKELFGGFALRKNLERTDQDISMAWLILGSLAIILTLWLLPIFPMNLFTVVLLVVLGFFFVAVTSITVGLVGSTSNPVSGMTLTTLLITCVCFVLLGWTEKMYLISAITMSCVACVAICMAGTTSQDLKTGFILGATPKYQQWGEIIGILIPSLALGGTIYILNEAYHIGSSIMPAPQATLLAMIAKGVIHGDLPYTLVGIGIVLGLVLEMMRLPILPFAIGLYLPLSLSTATMVGGIVAGTIQRKTRSETVKERGILFSSGLVGGDACTGILIAALTVFGIIPADAPSFLPPYCSLLLYALLATGLGSFILKKRKA